MVRLPAIDIDGTFVAQEGPCSARNRMALARAREAGVEIVLVTARPWQSVVPIARECELDGMAICSLGALTHDLTACEAADSRPLSPASLADAVDTLRALSSDIVFGVGDHRGSAGGGEVPSPSRVRDRHPRGRGSAGCAPLNPKPFFGRRLDRRGGGSAWWVGGDGAVVQRRAHITATGVTKLAALRDYCSRRSIPQTSVVAIGDTMVDLPMMRWAGMGIAVGDAAQQSVTPRTWWLPPRRACRRRSD